MHTHSNKLTQTYTNHTQICQDQEEPGQCEVQSSLRKAPLQLGHHRQQTPKLRQSLTTASAVKNLK